MNALLSYKYAWIGYILLASVGVAFFNLWQSKSELTYTNFVIACIGFISIGSLFWGAYYSAPQFLFCWMVSFVTTAICTILIDICIYHQVDYTPKFIVGFILISLGVYVMK